MTQTVDHRTLDLARRLEASVTRLGLLSTSELLDLLEGGRGDAAADVDARVTVGEVVPRVQLPDADGTPRDVLGDGPSVVVLHRGATSPACRAALAAYDREVRPELEERGVPFVAVGPEEDAPAPLDLAFPTLTDRGARFARRLGLVPDGADARGPALPRPAVLVVDGDRVVTFADVHSLDDRRTEPAAILEAVRALVWRRPRRCAAS